MKARGLIFYPDHSHRLMRALADLPYVRALRAHLFGKVGAVHLRNRIGFGYQLLRVALDGRDYAAHHAVVAQVPHQRARVDIRQHRHFELLQVLLGHLLRAPVPTPFRELAHDQAFDPRTRGFVIFLVGAVVTDLRIGQDNDLPRVGRIGENFLVAGDGSIKNDFAVAFAFGAVAFASEDSPVFQRKDSLHSRSGVWILEILSGKCAETKYGSKPECGNLADSRLGRRKAAQDKSNCPASALCPAYPSASTQTRPCRRYSSGSPGRNPGCRST